MKLDKNKCIGCGNCVGLSNSEIFNFDDDGLAEIVKTDLNEEEEKIAEDAINQCPTGAISK